MSCCRVEAHVCAFMHGSRDTQISKDCVAKISSVSAIEREAAVLRHLHKDRLHSDFVPDLMGILPAHELYGTGTGSKRAALLLQKGVVGRGTLSDALRAQVLSRTAPFRNSRRI